MGWGEACLPPAPCLGLLLGVFFFFFSCLGFVPWLWPLGLWFRVLVRFGVWFCLLASLLVWGQACLTPAPRLGLLLGLGFRVVVRFGVWFCILASLLEWGGGRRASPPLRALACSLVFFLFSCLGFVPWLWPLDLGLRIFVRFRVGSAAWFRSLGGGASPPLCALAAPFCVPPPRSVPWLAPWFFFPFFVPGLRPLAQAA